MHLHGPLRAALHHSLLPDLVTPAPTAPPRSSSRVCSPGGHARFKLRFHPLCVCALGHKMSAFVLALIDAPLRFVSTRYLLADMSFMLMVCANTCISVFCTTPPLYPLLRPPAPFVPPSPSAPFSRSRRRRFTRPVRPAYDGPVHRPGHRCMRAAACLPASE